MRRDLILGFLLSAVIHGGVFFGDRLIPDKKVVVVKKEEAPAIEIAAPPQIEPEEPEVVEYTDEPVKPLDFAPPSQVDVPQLVTDTSFVQRIQPPPPENVKPAAGLITIPENRDMSQFRGMQVFDINSLDQKPVPTYQAQPQYPFEMKRAGVGGEVTVDFLVDSSGAVQNARAVRSTHREFEQPAVNAVMKWKFKPGRKGGRNVVTHMQVPIAFTLTE